jgi:branched-chain amino acid transport system substrate-binding protein
MGTVTIILALAWCLSFGVAQAADDKIVLGVCEPLSGVMKDVGDRVVNTIKYSVEQINANGGVLGKKLVVVAEDSQLKADVATRKATKLILEDKADFIMTGVGSHVASAMMRVAEQNKKIFVTYTCEAASITRSEFTPYMFRVGLNTDQHSSVLTSYFGKHTNYKKFYILCQDYNFGREAADAFKKGIKKIPGGELLGEEYHPIGLKDFAPYITKIMASGAEVVLTGNYGPDLDNLIKTGASLGWKCITGNYFLDDPYRMQAIKEAAIGHVTADCYMPTIDTPLNKIFVKNWHERHKGMEIGYLYPISTMGRTYAAVQWLGDVIKKAGSTDSEKIIKTWEGMDYEMPWGRVTMRACDHQMITPGLIGVIEAKSEFYNTPFIGKPIVISAEEITVPPQETDNPRCK